MTEPESNESQSSMDFEVGQWVTLEAPNGWKVRGKVMKRTEGHAEVTYTVHQFPDSMPYASYEEKP